MPLIDARLQATIIVIVAEAEALFVLAAGHK
jgi:hypothetical protein